MLLEVEEICKGFPVNSGGGLGRGVQQVLQGVSLRLLRGECLGLIGESGSGKSTVGRLLLGLERPDSGCIRFADAFAAMPRVRRMGVVFQDYTSSINPRMTVEEALYEPMRILGLSSRKRREKALELLEEIGLSGDFLPRFPHQLSGGQLQRVCIARAIAPEPAFILFDEAVSSLDVSIQVQILDLLRELKERRRLSYLFITHDITVAAYMCERILVLHRGRIVEQIKTTPQFSRVQSPYARRLLDAAVYLEQSWEQ